MVIEIKQRDKIDTKLEAQAKALNLLLDGIEDEGRKLAVVSDTKVRVNAPKTVKAE